jgi:hypothetical protein
MTVWLVCNSNTSGQSISIQGGGKMQVGGTIYAPCASADIGNNATALQPPSGGSLSFIASQLYVHGSGSLSTASSPSTPAAMRLTN